MPISYIIWILAANTLQILFILSSPFCPSATGIPAVSIFKLFNLYNTSLFIHSIQTIIWSKLLSNSHFHRKIILRISCLYIASETPLFILIGYSTPLQSKRRRATDLCNLWLWWSETLVLRVVFTFDFSLSLATYKFSGSLGVSFYLLFFLFFKDIRYLIIHYFIKLQVQSWNLKLSNIKVLFAFNK